MKRYSLYTILLIVVLCSIITLSDASPSSLTSEHSDKKKKKKVHTNQKKRAKIDSMSGSTSSGTGTFYDTGPGSCGETDSNDDLVVAINKPQMHNGNNNNNNSRMKFCIFLKRTL